MRDLYEVLGVDRSATLDEIKKAYRKKAQQYHPDLYQGEDAQELFKELQNAYDILSDENRRHMYDRTGSTEQHNGFGGFDPFFNVFRQGFHQQQIVRGEPITLVVELTIEEIAKGGSKEISFHRRKLCETCNGSGGDFQECDTCNGNGMEQFAFNGYRTCSTCGGRGRKKIKSCKDCTHGTRGNETVTKTVNYPAGIDDGQGILYQREGHPIAGGENGPLRVMFSTKPHPLLQRGPGGQLFMVYPVSFAELLLGSEVKIPTLDNIVTVKIKPNTPPKARLRLSGLGLPVNRGSGVYKGDLIVELEVLKKTTITDEYKVLLEQLKLQDEAELLAARINIEEILGVEK